MSDPWKVDLPISEDNIINESERDGATPANDEYKLVKLEDDGRLAKFFLRESIVLTYDLADSPFTWNKPTRSDFVGVKFELWGAGASGASRILTGSAGGGGGGAYEAYEIDADSLPSSLDGVIGAGGAGVSGDSNGNAGGDTTLGSMRAKSGLVGTNDSSGAIGGNGGQNPYGYSIFGIYGQGKEGTVSGGGQKSGGGGFTGGFPSDRDGGDTIYGGAGGAGKTFDPEVRSGGTSVKGGDGGDSNARETAGSPGEVPGGGGGAAFEATSGAGAAGRVVVTEYYI